MQNIDLLNEGRQQFRAVQRIFRVRFILPTRLSRFIVIGICGQTWITETESREEKNTFERLRLTGRYIFTVYFPNHPADRFASYFCSTLDSN